MKWIAPAVVLSGLLSLAGCTNSPPPPPSPPVTPPPVSNSGVEVHAPGVEVKANKDGVEVKAPGTDVEVERKPPAP